MPRFASILLSLVCVLWTNLALAEGLLWNLPAPGTWVRYEGTYRQTEIRRDASGNLDLDPWIERITVKSVGSKSVDVEGEETPARWIEIKVERGRERDGTLDTGVTGLEIYQLLVAENAVLSLPVDLDGVPEVFVRVFEATRKIGIQEPKKLSENVVQLYPMGLLVGYFRKPELVESDVPLPAIVPSGSGEKWTGSMTIERPSNRTIHTATFVRSDAVPFGLVQWSVKIRREEKDALATRDSYLPQTEVAIEQKLVEIGDNAQPELPLP
jgi:hypothetical protein